MHFSQAVDKAEHSLIDQLIDSGSCAAGHNDYSVVHALYRKGLVYFDVPIEASDCVSVPPLEGFVMNRDGQAKSFSLANCLLYSGYYTVRDGRTGSQNRF